MVDLGDGAGDRRGVPQPAADEAQAAQDPNICSGSFPAPTFKAVVFPFFFLDKNSPLRTGSLQ